MDEKELKKLQDKLRSSTIGSETIDVIYMGRFGGFHYGKVIQAKARHVTGTGKPYPYPKWKHCDYRITDEDGDAYPISDNGTEFKKGFYPVGNKILTY